MFSEKISKPEHPAVSAAERLSQTPILRLVAIFSVCFWMGVFGTALVISGWFFSQQLRATSMMTLLVCTIFLLIGMRVGARFGVWMTPRVVRHLLSIRYDEYLSSAVDARLRTWGAMARRSISQTSH